MYTTPPYVPLPHVTPPLYPPVRGSIWGHDEIHKNFFQIFSQNSYGCLPMGFLTFISLWGIPLKNFFYNFSTKLLDTIRFANYLIINIY